MKRTEQEGVVTLHVILHKPRPRPAELQQERYIVPGASQRPPVELISGDGDDGRTEPPASDWHPVTTQRNAAPAGGLYVYTNQIQSVRLLIHSLPSSCAGAGPP